MNVATDYLHALDGRLRIKVAEVKGSPCQARKIQDDLLGHQGIDYVKANPTTGNVLIYYQPEKLSQHAVINLIKEMGYLQESKDNPSANPSSEGGGLAGLVARAAMESALQTLVMALI
ncbi:MAG: HMA2 domain-containing protein [Desulfobacteraceae bacterium]